MNEQTLYSQIQHVIGELVHTVPPDAWRHRTPCKDWDIRALVNHVVGENLWIPELFAGKTIKDVGDRLDGDVLGTEPAEAWDKASRLALESLEAPGALQRTVHLSFGDTKGSDYMLQMAIDQTIHAWDLATSLNRSVMWPEGHIEAVYERFKPVSESWRGPGGLGPAVKVDETADALTHLIALAGREPSWRS